MSRWAFIGDEGRAPSPSSASLSTKDPDATQLASITADLDRLERSRPAGMVANMLWTLAREVKEAPDVDVRALVPEDQAAVQAINDVTYGGHDYIAACFPEWLERQGKDLWTAAVADEEGVAGPDPLTQRYVPEMP